MRKVELLPTRDCEADYGPVHNAKRIRNMKSNVHNRVKGVVGKGSAISVYPCIDFLKGTKY